MTWLRPVDRTSGTLTLSAGTLSCLAITERPFRSVAPRRPRWNERQCRWTMRIVCLHWARSSRSVDNVQKILVGLLRCGISSRLLSAAGQRVAKTLSAFLRAPNDVIFDADGGAP